MNSTKRIIQGYLFSQSLAYIVAGFYLINFNETEKHYLFNYMGYILIAAFLLVLISLMVSIITSMIYNEFSERKRWENINWKKRYKFLHLKRRVAMTLDSVISPILPLLTVSALISDLLKVIIVKSNLSSVTGVTWIITIGLILFLLVQLLDLLKISLKTGLICLSLIFILILFKFLWPSQFFTVFVVTLIIAFLISVSMLVKKINDKGRLKRESSSSLYYMPRLLLLGAVVFFCAGIIAKVSKSGLITNNYWGISLCMMCIMTSFLTKLPPMNKVIQGIMQVFLKLTFIFLISGILYITKILWEAGNISSWLITASFILSFFIAFSSEFSYIAKKIYKLLTTVP